MGSTGTGSFTDYPGSNKSKGSKQEGGGQGGGGGPGADDRCTKAFSVTLEDVEHCDYYKMNGTGPKVGTVLSIALQKRVVATAGGLVVGNLPTGMNYLAACLKGGFGYTGKVQSSKAAGKVFVVTADFVPK